MVSNEKNPKKTPDYFCENCDFNTCNKKDFVRHTQTKKHNFIINQCFSIKKPQKTPNHLSNNSYICVCGKEYKDNSGLWRHKKKCVDQPLCNEPTLCEDISNKNDPTDKDLILLLIKENSELKNMMMKVIENGTNNVTTNNIHTNSHNKAFNLNFFLNETCKDAMNIMDFVESIQFQLSDLERVGEKGYIEGISDIIIKNLKNLDITQRPVHCTDKKRETIYVKDDNKWEKDEENIKMHKMIRKVQDKNFRMIKKFKEKYPYYNKASSKQSDVYNNIIIESMGGRGDNDYEKEEKIIKKVSKEVTIDK
jgi:hypothetical protein